MPVSKRRPKGRQRVLRDRARVPFVHPPDCDCEAVGHLVGSVECESCGREQGFDVWLPTSGAVGESREVFRSCSFCPGEASGFAKVTDRQ